MALNYASFRMDQVLYDGSCLPTSVVRSIEAYNISERERYNGAKGLSFPMYEVCRAAKTAIPIEHELLHTHERPFVPMDAVHSCPYLCRLRSHGERFYRAWRMENRKGDKVLCSTE